MFSIFLIRARTMAAATSSAVVMMIGTEMKKKPYIAQFSEYDLSSQARQVKNPDTNESSHNNAFRSKIMALLLLMKPRMRRTAERARNKKMIGNIMRAVDPSVLRCSDQRRSILF